MSTDYICARCSCELRPGQTLVFVRAMAICAPGPVELPDLDAAEIQREMAELLAQLNEMSALEANETVVVAHMLHLCPRCFSLWNWQRLRESDYSSCACCSQGLDFSDGTCFRAGFIAVELRGTESEDRSRVEAAQHALSHCLQQIADPQGVFGPDDLVAFSLCATCKSTWAEEPFDDRDFPE